jgi:argininosuccinate lyase
MKMKKLWQKNWELDEQIEAFETKDDLLLDAKLLPYDILGSSAHAAMLFKMGLLTKKELGVLRKGFAEIIRLGKKGRFELRSGDEDIHTKIETYLTAKYGPVGKKIHTGRSRNDQVLTALRLMSKDNILKIMSDVLALADDFASFARTYEFVPMPGYTHMQRAMPSSLGMWAGSFAEALLDDLKLLEAVEALSDQSPLGSAAGYGVPLPLDRKFAAKLMGFGKVQENSLYCQNSRGKFEGMALASLVGVLSDINRFASDILLFTTREFQFFTFADKFYSGSSIMPQKKNLDVAELLRSKAKKVLGNYVQVASLPLDLISGYNRDLQDVKRPMIESFEATNDALAMAALLVRNLVPVEGNLRQACSSEIFATHDALKIVSKGGSFREAYRKVGNDISRVKGGDPDATLRLSRHQGGTGNLGLSRLQADIRREHRRIDRARSQLKVTWKKLTPIPTIS